MEIYKELTDLIMKCSDKLIEEDSNPNSAANDIEFGNTLGEVIKLLVDAEMKIRKYRDWMV